MISTPCSGTSGVADDPPLTRHLLRAALHVASVLGHGSSPVIVAHESYWRRATGGVFSPADLRVGEDLLVAAGFVLREPDQLTVLPHLSELVDGDVDNAIEAIASAILGQHAGDTSVAAVVANLIDDPERREALLLALGRRFDDEFARQLGALGEEIVVAYARAELHSLGHADLARLVRRVSLISDQLGYDVTAPRVGSESPRLLEVKTTTESDGSGVFYMSRNEADVANRFSSWALVLCVVEDLEARTGAIAGWCQVSELAPMLPTDAPGGRWQSAAIEIERIRWQPGIPRPMV